MYEDVCVLGVSTALRINLTITRRNSDIYSVGSMLPAIQVQTLNGLVETNSLGPKLPN
jgi:hypothetical protein